MGGSFSTYGKAAVYLLSYGCPAGLSFLRAYAGVTQQIVEHIARYLNYCAVLMGGGDAYLVVYRGEGLEVTCLHGPELLCRAVLVEIYQPLVADLYRTGTL